MLKLKKLGLYVEIALHILLIPLIIAYILGYAPTLIFLIDQFQFLYLTFAIDTYLPLNMETYIKAFKFSFMKFLPNICEKP